MNLLEENEWIPISEWIVSAIKELIPMESLLMLQ